jgi:putative selenate reductase
MNFGKLMTWILDERAEHQQVFGLSKSFVKKPDGRFLHIFHEKLEIPFGPAAGPHTQLAQNIVAAYIGGARFFELKTVQTLDGEDLPVAKPCIDAPDEGYNCEWSTELRVQEAFEEYVRAWFALKLIAREFGLGDPVGFLFNMSVGYDLAGIKSEKIDGFIEGLKDAAGTPVWKECRDWAFENLERFAGVDRAFVEGVAPHVCSSVTLSTLHGCLPQEIERIAAYLIAEKKLHTFVKCNPTMLGYDTARSLLDSLGFGYVEFGDRHFKGDLQFGDAVPMFRRLADLAVGEGLTFGLKLSNTCPVDNTGDALPGDEMYMSGRALYPLTVTLAARLAAAFDGDIRISFSGGADYFNIQELFEAGVWPVTLATTLLKPGGYQRLNQIAEKLEDCEYKGFTGVDVKALEGIAAKLTGVQRNHKALKLTPSRKLPMSASDRTPVKLPLFDCFSAPCKGGCPIGQDVPEYLSLTARGDYLEALEVITEKNPLPFITGTICNHHCMEKCIRNYYEEPVYIRGAKLAAAENAFNALMEKIVQGRNIDSVLIKQMRENGVTWINEPRGKVAIVGGGPAGLAAAYFIARYGIPVTVFEKENQAGGVVRQAIPDFRIEGGAIDRDVELVKAMGAEIRTGAAIESLQELRDQGYESVILAIGAKQPGRLELEQGDSLNAIDFLKRFKEDKADCNLGKHVVVIGGGNTAMDAARAAKRTPGVESVSLVYRRDRRNMPADEEELLMALEEGVAFRELLAPVSFAGGKLKCHRMILGEPDSSGRRSPVETKEAVEVSADTVISAVGEKVDSAFYQEWGLALDKAGRPLVEAESRQSANKPGVYVIGDGLKGPATVVEAIADAQAAAAAILCIGRGFLSDAVYSRAEIIAKQGNLRYMGDPEKEGERCLVCSAVCEICVQVCPNRANVAIQVPGMGKSQIVHVDAMCNECGNCATFCPYESLPYKEKLTLFDSDESFRKSENQGFLLADKAGSPVIARIDGRIIKSEKNAEGIEGIDGNGVDGIDGNGVLPQEWRQTLATILADYSYLL